MLPRASLERDGRAVRLGNLRYPHPGWGRGSLGWPRPGRRGRKPGALAFGWCVFPEPSSFQRVFTCAWCFPARRPLFHLTEKEPIFFLPGWGGRAVALALQKRGLLSTCDADVSSGCCLAGSQHRHLMCLQNAGSLWCLLCNQGSASPFQKPPCLYQALMSGQKVT